MMDDNNSNLNGKLTFRVHLMSPHCDSSSFRRLQHPQQLMQMQSPTKAQANNKAPNVSRIWAALKPLNPIESASFKPIDSVC